MLSNQCSLMVEHSLTGERCGFESRLIPLSSLFSDINLFDTCCDKHGYFCYQIENDLTLVQRSPTIFLSAGITYLHPCLTSSQVSISIYIMPNGSWGQYRSGDTDTGCFLISLIFVMSVISFLLSLIL